MSLLIPKNKVQKILVLRPDAVGDVVLTLPLIGVLKKEFPNVHLTFGLNKAYIPLIKPHPDIDSFIETAISQQSTKHFLYLLNILKKEKFDLVVLPYLDFFYSLLCKMAGISYRIGDKNKLIPQLFLNYAKSVNYLDLSLHIIEQNVSLLESIGLTVSSDVDMSLFVENGEGQKMDQFLIDQGWTGEVLIGIQPSTGGSDRSWTVDGYVQLIELIESKPSTRVVLTGAGVFEESVIKLIEEKYGKSILKLIGFGTFPELKALIKKCGVFLGTNTGPLHVAAALKTPVVSLFPTKFQKPTQWGPWKVKHRIVRDTSGCTLDCNPWTCKYNYCIEKINAQTILNAIKELRSDKGNTLLAKQYWFKTVAHLLVEINSNNIDDPNLKSALGKLSDWGVKVSLLCNNSNHEVIMKKSYNHNVLKSKKNMNLISKIITNHDITIYFSNNIKFINVMINILSSTKMYVPPKILNSLDIINKSECLEDFIQAYHHLFK